MLKAPTRKHPAAKTRRKGAVHVKYPRPGETVSRPHYAVQVETPPEPVRVELRVNDEDWNPCREALGLWWFDWTGFKPGAHRLIARVMTQDGEVIESIEREIVVI